MVSWKGHKLDLASFIELSNSDIIFGIEMSGIKWENSLAIWRKRLEPSCFFWVDNMVIFKFDQHRIIKR
jgi:hypothetical protein